MLKKITIQMCMHFSIKTEILSIGDRFWKIVLNALSHIRLKIAGHEYE